MVYGQILANKGFSAAWEEASWRMRLIPMLRIQYSWLEITPTPRECAGLTLVLGGLGVDSGFMGDGWQAWLQAGWVCSWSGKGRSSGDDEGQATA
jgi:hypothetical protein